MSVYDPLIPEPGAHEGRDLERVQAEFREASRPFLGSRLTWMTWAIVLPAAALITARLPADAYAPILFTWSGAVLVGGLVEGLTILRRAQRRAPTPLGAWALRSQGNLSLVGVALSVLLIWQGLTWTVPGVWLLLLGHSLFLLGGLACRPMRVSGIVYQVGGIAALLPTGLSLEAFALATGLANLWMAWSAHRNTDALWHTQYG